MRRIILRFLNVFRGGSADREVDREIASHLALLEDEHRRRGLSPDHARLAARRALGSVALVKDQHRDSRSFAWLDDLQPVSDEAFFFQADLEAMLQRAREDLSPDPLPRPDGTRPGGWREPPQG